MIMLTYTSTKQGVYAAHAAYKVGAETVEHTYIQRKSENRLPAQLFPTAATIQAAASTNKKRTGNQIHPRFPPSAVRTPRLRLTSGKTDPSSSGVNRNTTTVPSYPDTTKV